MRSAEQTANLIAGYKNLLLKEVRKELDEYDLGMLNGLEMALSLLEDRPVFYYNKQGKHSEYDINKYPDYFI